MTDYLPPPRSLISVTPVPGGVEVLCDCAFGTLLDFSGIDPAALPIEQSFVCDGCQSVHWFTLTAVPGGAA